MYALGKSQIGQVQQSDEPTLVTWSSEKIMFRSFVFAACGMLIAIVSVIFTISIIMNSITSTDATIVTTTVATTTTTTSKTNNIE